MHQEEVDLMKRFGVQESAAKILGMLIARLKQDQGVNDRCLIRSFAFYNGRERWAGVSISSYRSDTPTKAWIFGENRNSDDLCVESADVKSFLNPPTIREWPGDAYHARRFFSPDAYMEVVSELHLQIRETMGPPTPPSKEQLRSQLKEKRAQVAELEALLENLSGGV
jgi:hypothetical protein